MHLIPLIARYFNQAIIIYDVSDEGVFGLCGQFTPEEKEEKEEQYRPMTIDQFYAILQCEKNGQTKIVCLEEKIWAPQFLYERAFSPSGKYGRPPFIC